MKLFIKKTLLIITFLGIHGFVFAQKMTDGKFLFKTWLFLEKNNSTSRYDTLFPVKDSSLFSLFQKEINLNLDTLKTHGFSKDYIFLSVAPYKDNEPEKDNAIIYKDPKLIQYLIIPISNCTGYTLCINKVKGTSYRLQGFSNNDFLNLLSEVQEENIENLKGVLSVKSFLKSYQVEGLDFDCLYKGLTSGKTKTTAYPCLKKCSYSVITIQ